MTEKILIVDDDIETLRLVGLMLERQGFKIVAAQNGSQVIPLAHAEHPDLILLDVMMPEMDGFQVSRQLRLEPELSHIPILMFTARSQVEDKVVGYESGVDDYITKPIHPAELTAHIRALLTKSRMRSTAVEPRGYTLAVLGAKGGLGTSTVALNLGLSYHHKTHAEVICAEMRPGAGSWGIELGQGRVEGLNNLLSLKPGEITVNRVGNELVRMPFGIRILFTTSNPKDIDLNQASEQLETLSRHLQTLGALIVFDLGTLCHPVDRRILELCQETVVVTEPYPATAQRTRILVDDLVGKGFGKSRYLSVVMVNRVRADMQLSINQMQDILGYKVTQLIPPAPEISYQAAARNLPMIQVQVGGLLAQQYSRLADTIESHIQA